MRNALFAAVLLFGACVPPVQRTDPYATLGIAPADSGAILYPDLKVGLLLSDTTRGTHEYLSKMYSDPRWMGSPNPKVWVAPDTFLGDVSAVFRRRFGSVRELRSMDEAPGSGLDLIAVVDLFAQFKNIGGTDIFEANAILVSPERKEVARLSGKAERRVPIGLTRIDRPALEQQAVRQFEDSLVRSPELAAFAGRSPAAATAPPAAGSDGAVDQPSYRSPERASDFALVVGVEKYQSAPPAAYAARDAEAVRRHLAALGVPARNTVFLTDANAGYSALKKYIQSWLPRNLTPQSRLYFYYSGHGAPEPATGKAYLMPYDGDPNFLKDTAYPLDELYARLSELPAKEVFVALDACFSGAGGRSVLPKGARPLVVSVDAAETSRGRLALVTAASGAEITSTLEGARHGIFTYYLLKGLGGEAADAKGRVTLKGLFDYLKPRVQDEARRQNRDQTPTLRVETDLVLRPD